MIKDIIVLPRRAIPELDTPLSWAMISIATHEDTWPEYDEKNCKKVLRLAFNDADFKNSDNPNNEGTTEDQLFDKKRANLILDFINEVEVDMLVVHCEAGVSRSPAIAAVIAKILFNDDSKFFKAPYTPNMHVYRVLLDTAHERLGVL